MSTAVIIVIITSIILVIIIIVVLIIVLSKDTPAKLGENCNNDIKCDTGLTCSNSICYKSNGQPCILSSECLPTSSCTNGFCVAETVVPVPDTPPVTPPIPSPVSDILSGNEDTDVYISSAVDEIEGLISYKDNNVDKIRTNDTFGNIWTISPTNESHRNLTTTDSIKIYFESNIKGWKSESGNDKEELKIANFPTTFQIRSSIISENNIRYSDDENKFGVNFIIIDSSDSQKDKFAVRNGNGKIILRNRSQLRNISIDQYLFYLYHI